MKLLTKIIVVLLIATAASSRSKMLTMEETFFLPQAVKHTFADITLSSDDRNGDLILPWSGANTTSLDSTPKGGVYTCPWTYVVVYNPNRVPTTIIEASCSIEQCKPREENEMPDEEMLPQVNEHKGKFKCIQVKYLRWVLVKDHQRLSGKWKYVKRLLPVTVGCTCKSNAVGN